MIHLKDIFKIEFEDIEKLILNSIPESTYLDYKQELPSTKDSDKKDFAHDVAAFANKEGGVIIFGISEKREEGGKTGLPEKIVSTPSNADDHIKRLEEYARSYILPRLHQVQIREIKSADSSHRVIFMKIQKSRETPHLVRFGSDQRFYRRGNSGKYEMDVAEIRQAFVQGGLKLDQIKSFRSTRIENISRLDTPVLIAPEPSLVLHYVPVQTYSDQFADVSTLKGIYQVPTFLSRNGRLEINYNLNGLVTKETPGRGKSHTQSYIQFFRDGALESYDSYLFNEYGTMNLSYVCPSLIKAIETYVAYSKGLGLSGSVFVGLSILNSEKMEAYRQDHDTVAATKLPKCPILVPEVLIDIDGGPIDMQIRPLLDMLYNAAGFASCNLFNSEGRFDLSMSRG